MFKFLMKHLNPTAEDLVKAKLEKAKRELVEGEEALEYWTAHAPMLRRRVERLQGVKRVEGTHLSENDLQALASCFNSLAKL